jgi:hypothetical protein
MTHSVMELAVVLGNLASGGRRGGSCACPGAASRVVALEFLLGRHPYADSRARLTEDRRPHRGGRGDVPSIQVPTVLGMTLQCLGRRHSGGDGRIGPEVMEETRSAGLTSWRRLRRRGAGGRTPSEGVTVFFRGGQRGGSTGVGRTVSLNDTGLPGQHPHSAGDGRTVRVGRTASGYDSQAVLEGWRGEDSPLTRAPLTYQSI